MLVQIHYDVNFTAPFHMGTGISTNALDRTIMRDANKLLYIPASTFKGVLREQCEHLLRFYVPSQEITSPHEPDAILREFRQTPTLISRIFGSQLHAGGLRFDDIKQQPGLKSYENLQTSVLTQVRIDRLTGTAVDKALYSSEFGNPLLTFSGRMKGQLNCTPIEELAFEVEKARETHTLTPTCSLLLLLAGILLVERLGGNKSTGKGACSCTITQLTIDGWKCSEEDENKKGWRFWLEHLDRLSDYMQNEKGEQA